MNWKFWTWFRKAEPVKIEKMEDVLAQVQMQLPKLERKAGRQRAKRLGFSRREWEKIHGMKWVMQ
jgi:hypothetical protein